MTQRQAEVVAQGVVLVFSAKYAAFLRFGHAGASAQVSLALELRSRTRSHVTRSYQTTAHRGRAGNFSGRRSDYSTGQVIETEPGSCAKCWRRWPREPSDRC